MFFTKIAPELLKGKHIHPAVIITNLYILKPLQLKVLISPYDFIMDAKVDIMYVSSLTFIEYQSLHDIYQLHIMNQIRNISVISN